MKTIITLAASIALAALTVVSLTAPANAQNLITNPGFESGITGWTPTGNGNLSTYAFYRDMTPTPPAFGTRLFAFNGGDATPNAVLSQSFATTPGASYSVSFVYGNYTAAAQSGTQSVIADAVNTSDSAVLNFAIATKTAFRTTTFAAVMNTTYTFVFTPTGANTTLRFTDSPTSATESSDGILDNVSVVAVTVPEVGSVMLLGAGLVLPVLGTVFCVAKSRIVVRRRK
ncbi:MAG: hypothetical protein H7Y38_10940 [Armatimonadetes bacterium]|nr:hypothetical protein [Armatimonadota bacterium]